MGGVLVPSLHPDGPSTGPVIVMAVRGGEVSVKEPERWDGASGEGALFVGTVDGRHVWAVDSNVDGRDGEAFVDLMRLYGSVTEPMWAAAGRAVQLVEWNRNHSYCGRCAAPTEVASGERARRC